MSEILISFVLNIILGIIIVSLVFRPKLIQWYTKRKKQAQIQRKQEIQRVVIDYLNELKKDD